MKKEATGQLAESLRPWVSLAITIHFFAIIISLVANLSPSELERRLLKVLTPYTVSLHQAYQGVPLEMTRGTEIDHPCALEIRHAGAQRDQWQQVAPPHSIASLLDRRWPTFERTLGIIATELNEPLVHLLFEHCVRREEAVNKVSVDSVRLVRRASLSYAADQAYVAGELPQADKQDRTLFECRVVKLDGDRLGLIPVLESLRTSKSRLQPAATPDHSRTPESDKAATSQERVEDQSALPEAQQ